MSAQHTPGPWEIDYGYNRIIKSIGPCVPDEYAGSAWLEVTEANARLIAAAPDLLEALKQVAMWLPIMTEIAGLNAEETQVELSEFADDPNRHSETISIASSLEKARAAIAKAIG